MNLPKLKSLIYNNKFCFLCLLVLVFLIGLLGNSLFVNKCNYSSFKYINPDLVCEDKMIISKKGYFKAKTEIQDYIDRKIEDKQLNYFSLYFRDLQNGPTLGINEHEKFSPASLLKLPMLLTYLNLQIDDPNILNTEIGFKNINSNLYQYYPSKISAEENKPYKISELLDYMIKYSDNKSYFALREYLGQISPNEDLVQQIYIDLGLTDPKSVDEQTLSVKSYASIFVQLYHNSFFPNKELSEQALEVLANTEFTEGLVQGVPGDITVAHKFGERSLQNEKQLHDCGIIYYPGNPYLLCIMTRGPEFFILSQVISDISEMIFNEIESRRIN